VESYTENLLAKRLPHTTGAKRRKYEYYYYYGEV
jgi:hypothetical protein